MPRIVYTYRSSSTPQSSPPNLLMRVAAGVVSVLILAASAFLGLFIFAAVLGILAIAGTVLAARLWLYKRRVEAALKWGASQNPRKADYIDVESVERER